MYREFVSRILRAAFILGMFLAHVEAGTVYRVTATANGSGNGSSWSAPMTLSQAMAAAVNGDEIWIAAGTYRPTTGTDRALSISIPNGVTVYGGFVGVEPQRNQRDWRANPTILSGDIGIVNDMTDNSRHVVITHDNDILDGLIIEGGRADGATSDNSGAGIWAMGATTVRNCIIRNHSANYTGAGMANGGNGNMVVQNSVFQGNKAPYGAAYVGQISSGSHTFINVVMYGNGGPDPSNGNATTSQGSVAWFNNPSSWTNCTIFGNTDGNAPLYFNSGSHTVTNTIIYGNTGTVTGSYTGTSNVFTDPTFVNSASPLGADGRWFTGDDGLALQVSSSAVNTGTSANAPSGDVRGASRAATAIDVGAYERNARWYVDATANGVGESWAQAAGSLSLVTNAAGVGDDIWVRAGTYRPTAGGDRGATFRVPLNGSILGGFNGTETRREARNHATNRTILSGNIGNSAVSTDNSYHVVTGATGGVIDGVVITDGRGEAGSPYVGGGGIYMSGGSSFSVSNCIIANNQTAYVGGGLLLYGVTGASITGCLFTNNSEITANNYGGAFMCWMSTATLTNCTFINNTATYGSVGEFFNGSDTANPRSTLLRNCILWGNAGTALYNNDATSTVYLTNSILQGGIAGQYAGGSILDGGGTIASDPLLTNSSDPIGPDGLWFTDDDGALPGFGGPAVNWSGLTNVPSMDLTGRARPQMSLPDIGCYEVPNTVTITASDANAAEAGLDTGAITVTRSGPTTVPQIVVLTVAGSSTASASDFTMPATVTIPVGMTSATALITPVDDLVREDVELVTVQIANGNTATISITSDDVVGIVASTTDLTINEASPGNTASFSVRLTSQPTAPATITMASGNAAEYLVSPASVTFQADATAITPQTVTVTAINDDMADGNQVSNLTFSVASSDSTYQGRAVTPISITTIDDDMRGISVTPASLTISEGRVGSFSVALASQPFNQGNGSNVTLTLTSAPSNWVTLSGALSTTLTFTPNNWKTPQTVTVVAQDDDWDQPSGTTPIVIGFTASGADYGGTWPSYDINVDDNDPMPQLMAVDITASKRDVPAVAKATVKMVGKSSNPVTVHLVTSDGTASAGVQYAATSGDLTWNAGETGIKTIDIPLVAGTPDAGDKTFTVGVALTTGTATLTDNSGLMTITDYPNAGVLLTLSGTQTSESDHGTTASVHATVRLAKAPSSTVTIPFTITPSTEVLALNGVNRLVFTSVSGQPVTQVGQDLTGGYDVDHVIDIAGVDDTIDDGDQSVVLHFGDATGHPTSSDTAYAALVIADQLLINRNVNVAGVVVSPLNGLTTTEAGGVAVFTVKLQAKPLADVTLSVSSSNTSEGTVDQTSLTFTPSNYQIPQIVMVTGHDDAVADGNQAYQVVVGQTVTVSHGVDAAYAAVASRSVSLTNLDNDTAGVLISVTNLALSENPSAGTHTAAYTVRLASEPTGTVTVTVDGGSQATVDMSSLTFTPSTWSSAQTVHVTAIDDVVAEANPHPGQVIHSVSSTDAHDVYANMSAPTVTLSITDNDVADVVIRDSTGSGAVGTLQVAESGTTATFTMMLASKPTANVVVVLTTDDSTEGSVSPASVAFDPTDWNLPKSITVMGIDDRIHDGTVTWHAITSEALSSDQAYNNFNASDVTVITTDDDVPGLVVNVIGTPTTTESGGAAAFQVALGSQPQAGTTVTVRPTSNAPGEIATSADLVFTPSNWSSFQTVTLTGVDDDVHDGDQTVVVTLSVVSSGGGRDVDFDGLTASVSAKNMDNDLPGIVVSRTSGLMTSEAGQTDTFTLRLACQPTAPVSIALSSSNIGEGTVSYDRVEFVTTKDQALSVSGRTATAGWNVPVTITVTGQDDRAVDGTRAWSVIFGTATSSDTEFIIKPPDITVMNVDNEVPIAVTPSSLVLTEGDADGIVMIALSGPLSPGRTVTIPVSLSDYAQATLSATSVTFTSANAAQPQAITITPTADGSADGNATIQMVIGAATSDDPLYAGYDAPDIPVLVKDQDVIGLRITPTIGLVTSEAGSTATVSMRLGSRPTADVTVTVTGTSEIAVTPATLTFHAADWNVEQSFTLTGQDDQVHDGDRTVNLPVQVASADINYAGLIVAPLQVINLDDDAPGILAIPSHGSAQVTEGGAADEAQIRLTSQPTGTVTVTLVPDAQLTVTPSVLTFTPSTWNTVQTVLLRAVDDAMVEGTHQGSIGMSATGGGYDGVVATSLRVTITDNDVAGILVSPTSGIVTTEAGGSGAFSITLRSQPTADVSFTITSSNSAEVMCSTGMVTFTPSNWSTAQVVTVTGVDDNIQDGDATVTIALAPASSADSNYQGQDPADVAVLNKDNDVAGLVVTPSTGWLTNEAGGTATLQLRLSSQPTADVTATLSTAATTEVTLSQTVVTFTPSTWSMPQSVVVQGVPDGIPDGDKYVVIHIATESADQLFAGRTVTATGTNQDIDSPGLLLSMPDGAFVVTEGQAATQRLRVALRTMPAQPVTVTLTDGSGRVQVIPDHVVLTDTTPMDLVVGAVDDDVAQGDLDVALGVATASADATYHQVQVPSVWVHVQDNEQPGIIVTPTTGLTTTEAGGTATFTVVLQAKPRGNVMIGLSSSDTSQGTVAPSSLTFTPAQWDQPQTATITGADTNGEEDGDVGYRIVTAPAVTASVDDPYHGVDAADVLVVNRVVDNPPTIDQPANVTMTEDGGQQTVTLTGITSGQASEVQSLVVTAVSSDATVTGIPHVVYEDRAVTGQVQFTPPENAAGVATIHVSVSDGTTTVTTAFTVTVTAVNDLPVVTRNQAMMVGLRGSAALQGAQGDPAAQNQLAATDVETAASALLFRVMLVPGGGTLAVGGVTISNGGSFTQTDVQAGRVVYTHGGGSGTSDGFTFRVEDGSGGSSSPDVFQIIIDRHAPDVTLLPTVPASLTMTENDPDVLLADQATMVDVDNATYAGAQMRVQIVAGAGVGDAVVISARATPLGPLTVDTGGVISIGGIAVATKTGGTQGADLVVTGTPQATPAHFQAMLQCLAFHNASDNPDGGTRTLSMTVTDPDGNATVMLPLRPVTVVPVNDVPILTAPVVVTVQDRPCDGTITATDPDSVGVTMAITTSAAKGSVQLTNAATGTFHYIPATGQTGSDTFVVTASDGIGTSLPLTVHVEITGAGTAKRPWIISDAPLEAQAGDTVRIPVTVDARELGSAPSITFGMDQAPAGVVVIQDSPTTAVVTWTLPANASGYHTVVITAVDAAAHAMATLPVTLLIHPQSVGGG